MKQIKIDISDNIKGIECDACERKFIVSKEEFEEKKVINCPYCKGNKKKIKSWDDVKSKK